MTEVEDDIHFAGKSEHTTGTTALSESICVTHDAFFDGEVKIFKKALINGHMFHSATYMKVTQRKSYTVDFAGNTFGEIIYFVLIENSA